MVTTKLTPYRKLLVMGKEALDEVLAPVRSRSAQKKAELEVAKLEERIATLDTELTTLCSSKDLNFDRIIDKLDEMALAARRKKQFDKILTEMFPDI